MKIEWTQKVEEVPVVMCGVYRDDDNRLFLLAYASDVLSDTSVVLVDLQDGVPTRKIEREELPRFLDSNYTYIPDAKLVVHE